MPTKLAAAGERYAAAKDLIAKIYDMAPKDTISQQKLADDARLIQLTAAADAYERAWNL